LSRKITFRQVIKLNNEDVEKAYELGEKSRETLQNYFEESVFFTWKWWLAVSIFILVWGLWFIFRKKESTDRLLYGGFFVMLISSWLDFLGVHFGLWYYKIDILPTPPSFLLWDFCLMPVAAMFIIQIRPSLPPYIKAVLFGALAAFVGEPIFVWLGYYVRVHWEYYYSFVLEILIFLTAHYISNRNRFEKFR
jgi:hypothetical protein